MKASFATSSIRTPERAAFRKLMAQEYLISRDVSRVPRDCLDIVGSFRVPRQPRPEVRCCQPAAVFLRAPPDHVEAVDEVSIRKFRRREDLHSHLLREPLLEPV